jgi:hypothetical protein
VVAEDVVAVINYINAKGMGPVDVSGNPAVQVVAQAATGTTTMFYDVTGDDYVAANDVIAIINFINAHPRSQPVAYKGLAEALSEDSLVLLLASDAWQAGQRKM